MSATVSTIHGETVEVSAESLEVLASSGRGSVLTPESPGYDEARTIWNGMIDRRPGLVVRCAGQADVVRAVGFATERELLIAVRGAGHQPVSW